MTGHGAWRVKRGTGHGARGTGKAGTGPWMKRLWLARGMSRRFRTGGVLPCPMPRAPCPAVAFPLQHLPLPRTHRQAHLRRQCLGRKEAEHRAQPIDLAVAEAADHAEVLDDHAGAGGHIGEFDLGDQRAGASDEFGHHRTLAVEVAETEFRRAGQRRADIARQPAARLQRGLQQHPERHDPRAVVVEVPGLIGDVVLGDHARTGAHHTNRAFDRPDPTDEEVRRTGQARHAHRTVKARIHRPEGLRRAAECAGEQAVRVEGEAVNARGSD